MPNTLRKNDISIVIPLYGQFDIERAIVSVESVLVQKNVNLEVVVSEQGESPKFPKKSGVKHTFKYHRPKPELSDFNPGKVRNDAIALARGEFVYTNDADIIFLDPHYLAKSIEEMRRNPDMVLYRPFMRRLPLEEFKEFERMVHDLGIDKAVASLNLSQEYIATVTGKPQKIRVFKKDSVYPKTFTAFEEDFQAYASDDKNKGSEPMFWNENRHCGGNLFRIEQFRSVGGYSGEFINWGCEDSDLQWKFRETYDLQFFPEDLEVMHLDHPKKYFSSKMWARNEEISVRRIEEGLAKAIETDRRNKLWQSQ